MIGTKGGGPMDIRRNMLVQAGKDSCYNVSLLFVSGTMVQLFLAHKGVTSAQIGVFSSVLQIVSMAVMVLLSDVAERFTCMQKACSKLLLIQAVLYLLYLPVAAVSTLGSKAVFWCVMLISSIQTVFVALRSIWEYKLLYEIAPVRESGTLMSFGGIGVGIVGMVSGWLFSALIEKSPTDRTYLICMAIGSAALFLAAFFCRQLKVISQVFTVVQNKQNHFSEIKAVLLGPDFRNYIIPNAMRGITNGVFVSITLIAMASGLSAGNVARLSVMSTLGFILGSTLYYFLTKRCRASTIGILGSILLCACFFMSLGGPNWFLGVYMVSYVGKVLMDYAVVVVVMENIEPTTSGIYNTWRIVIFTLISAATVLVIGMIVEQIDPLWFLIPCGLCYLISMLWYAIGFGKKNAQA